MGLEKRVRELESLFHVGAEEYPDWPFDLQVDDTLCYLEFHQRFRSPPQGFTDRQINILGALYALEMLGGEAGEYNLPASGVVVTWQRSGAEDALTASWSGNVSVEDLAEGVREYVKRMPAAEQPKREAFLYERRGWRQREQEDRERFERERERLKEKSRIGTLNHLAELERLGINWGDSRESHERYKQQLLDHRGWIEGRGWICQGP